jgi:superfamily II DNA or RNA helicase
MSLIIQKNNWITCEKLPFVERKYLMDMMQFEHKYKNVIKNTSKKHSDWDGMVRLYKYDKNSRTLKFRSGFLKYVIETLKSRFDRDVEVYDKRRESGTKLNIDFVNGFKLRDYQEKAVKEMISNGGVCSLYPGLGKTEIGIGYINETKRPTIFLVGRVDLMYQAYDRFKLRLGKEVGLIGNGVCNVKPITIAMIQTLDSFLRGSKRLNIPRWIFNSFDNIVVDECHHVATEQYERVLFEFKSKYLSGLTATPFRSDGMETKIFGYLGGISYELDPSEAVKRGWIVPAKIKVHGKDSNNYRYSYGYLDPKEMITKLIRDDGRNKLIRAVSRDSEKPFIIFTERVEHADELSKLCGVPSVKGELKKDKRRKIKKDLDFGKIDGVVVTSVWDEGVDLKPIRSILFSTPFVSPVLIYQRIGRGMRAYKDKKFVTVHDFHDFYFSRSFEERENVYLREKLFEY